MLNAFILVVNKYLFRLYLTTFSQIFGFLRVYELTLFLHDFTGTLGQDKRQSREELWLLLPA
jgi:hypothetical protein